MSEPTSTVSVVGPLDPDVALLRDVLEWLTANRAAHDQSVYVRRMDSWEAVELRVPELACNTVGCLAGWTALRAGYEPYLTRTLSQSRPTGATSLVIGPARDDLTDNWGSGAADDWGSGAADDPYPAGSVVYGADEVARSLLRLPVELADRLFHADNTLADLWRFAELYTDGRITVPARLRDDESQWNDDDWASLRARVTGTTVVR